MVGICRSHCSKGGYCGTGDDYVFQGMDCTPCADGARQGGGPAAPAAAAAAAAAREPAPRPLELATDRSEAVCFGPPTARPSARGEAAGCLGGTECARYAQLAQAQAACSRDQRCAAVAVRPGAGALSYELRASADPPTTGQDALLDELLWLAQPCVDLPGAGAAAPQIYFSVKTSAANGNHGRRPLSLLRSWAATASVRNRTYFFTDAAERDPTLLAMSGGAEHWIDTGCGARRGRALCCKTDAELRGFLQWARRRAGPGSDAGSQWWCHVDDDNYVLLGPLQAFLSGLSSAAPRRPYYVGRAGPTKHGNRLGAPFAMGGAGYCLNLPAAKLAAAELGHGEDGAGGGGGLQQLCQEIDYPDDMALGVLLTQRLSPPVGLTEDPLAHESSERADWHGGLFGGRFHSQWEIYGHTLPQLMAALVAPRPPPHEQFIYGWDRETKQKTSAPRDMLELHYFLQIAAAASVCYGAKEPGPPSADGALHTHRYGSLRAAMASCNEQGSACEAVASLPPLGGGSGCVFVLFGSDMAGASGFGGGGAGDQCAGAYRKQRGWCMEPRIWGR